MAWSSTAWHSDDFNRSDSDTVGTGWNERYGDLDIVSNKVKAIGSNSLLRYDDLDLSLAATPADYVVEFEFDFDAMANFVFVVGRWDGTDNGSGDPIQCYFVYLQPTGGSAYDLYLYKRTTTVAGQVLLGSSGGSLTGQKKVRLEMLGTSIKAVVDGVDKISVTDSTHTTQGYCGARMGTNVTLDNFAVYSESNPPSYVDLDETVTLVDTVTKSTTRALNDALSLVTNVVKAPTKSLTEALPLVDTITKSTTKLLSEQLPLIDTLTKTPTKLLAETIVLVDTISKSITRVLTDTLTLVDSVTQLIVGLYIVTLNETITITDTFAKLKSWFTKSVTNWYTKDRDNEYN